MSMPMDTIISENNLPEISAATLSDFGFYWREREAVKVLICKPLEDAGFANGFSTRLGGVSDFPENSLNLAGYDEDSAENIEENRRRFLGVFEENYKLASAWQVHGNDVKIIKNLQNAENSDEKFDALISNLPNILVGVKTADCVPVLIGDTKPKATRQFRRLARNCRINRHQINRKMRREFGTKPENLICAVGAAASGKNYEIGQDVIDAFEKNFPDSKNLFTETRKNHAFIDLHLANKEQLTSVGVSEKNIFTAPFCTMERPDLFFSYRLEKKVYGKTGRLMSVIGLQK